MYTNYSPFNCPVTAVKGVLICGKGEKLVSSSLGVNIPKKIYHVSSIDNIPEG
jgi:hypothetical protein